MKTAMILPVWLDNDDYFKKTKKFLDYYTNPDVMKDLGITKDDIWIIDNASDPDKVDQIVLKYGINVKNFHKHYTRTAHLEYLYCWRCLYFARDLFQEFDYDKVIHLNNDVFILSKFLANYIRDFKSGWWTPWCKRHSFPECDLQVITKDCSDYWSLTGKPYIEYNGKHMEWIIKATPDKSFIGDRHSEYGIKVQDKVWDFSCQVPLDMKIEYKNG